MVSGKTACMDICIGNERKKTIVYADDTARMKGRSQMDGMRTGTSPRYLYHRGELLFKGWPPCLAAVFMTVGQVARDAQSALRRCLRHVSSSSLGHRVHSEMMEHKLTRVTHRGVAVCLTMRCARLCGEEWRMGHPRSDADLDMRSPLVVKNFRSANHLSCHFPP